MVEAIPAAATEATGICPLGKKLKGMDGESNRCGNLLHLLTSLRRKDAIL